MQSAAVERISSFVTDEMFWKNAIINILNINKYLHRCRAHDDISKNYCISVLQELYVFLCRYMYYSIWVLPATITSIKDRIG